MKRIDILVDMDGPIANIEQAMYERMCARFPDVAVPPKNRKNFYHSDDYPREFFPVIREILEGPGLFAGLEPVPGAFEAINQMLENGFEVMICTAPVSNSKTCAAEKLEWIQKFLGKRWVNRVIIAKDKTWVRGDYLIDDRPDADTLGKMVPVWKHVLYSYPYNLVIRDRPRLTWDNWRDVFEELTGIKTE